jgi:hypothetical protein
MENNTRLIGKLAHGEITCPQTNLLETGCAEKVNQHAVLVECLP